MSIRRAAPLVYLILLAAAIVPTGVGAADEPVGRVIVQFRAGTSADARRAARAESAVTVYTAGFPAADAELWRVPAGTEAAVVGRAGGRNDVLYAEADQLQQHPSSPVRPLVVARSYLPLGHR